MTRTIALLILVVGVGVARADDTSAADDASVTISLPAERNAGCFADAMRIPRELAGRLPERATITFTVEETGALRDVLVDGHGAGALATQVRGGLSRCAWTPAADAFGVPMTVAVLLPVRFESAATSPAVATAVRVEPGALVLAAR